MPPRNEVTKARRAARKAAGVCVFCKSGERPGKLLCSPCAISQSKRYKRYRDELRRAVLSHYSNGALACRACGYDTYEALDLDHLNNDGHEDRKKRNTQMLGIALRREGYPPGYQVLCRNCNWLKHANGGKLPPSDIPYLDAYRSLRCQL